MQQYIIDGKEYKVVDSLQRIPTKDSFTDISNKIGNGSGAWEWHIGSKNDSKNYDFFGGKNFESDCFLKKADLLRLIEEMKSEYDNPSQNYRKRDQFNKIWKDRYDEISEKPEIIRFKFREHNNRNQSDSRLYAMRPGNEKDGDHNYGLIRKIALPNITYVSILKLKNIYDKSILFYFKIFSDNEQLAENEESEIVRTIQNDSTIIHTDKLQIVKSRIGQGIFRDKLIHELSKCPFTEVDDPKLLIASHIKPWKSSNNDERLSSKNGLLLTPTYDKLFDKGFISFENNKKLIISDWISKENQKRLNLIQGTEISNLELNGRLTFLEYHRDVVFLS